MGVAWLGERKNKDAQEPKITPFFFAKMNLVFHSKNPYIAMVFVALQGFFQKIKEVLILFGIERVGLEKSRKLVYKTI